MCIDFYPDTKGQGNGLFFLTKSKAQMTDKGK